MTTSTRFLHTRPDLVDLPDQVVVAVDGSGRGESPAFAAALDAIHEVVGTGIPLQGTWWSSPDRMSLDLDDPDGWHWTLAAPVPADHPAPPAGGAVRRETVPAHRAVRVLHFGPYEDEGPSLAALYEHAASLGLRPTGPHTEVYLNDPGATAPADLRTELRLPVA